MNLVYLNGNYYQKQKATISPFDRGFLYGDGIFETIRTREHEYLYLDEHIKRLFNSAKLLKIKIGYSAKEIKVILKKFLQKNKLLKRENYRIRISISRGNALGAWQISANTKPTIFIFGTKIIKHPKNFFKKGVKVIVAKTRRNSLLALAPQAKSTNYLNNILAGFEKDQAKAYEAIMLSTADDVAEGTISNIFWFKRGVLFTPSVKVGILPGITRDKVLQLAKKMKFKVNQGFYKKQELLQADEIFITSTSQGIVPVTKLGQKKISAGKIGRLTNKLKNNFY